MRGSLIPTAKRLINRTAPINPTDLSEANANNYMFLFDELATGDYIQDSAVIARHIANLRAREQSSPNLTLEVLSGSATFQTTFVSFAGGNSPSFTAPAANPRIDLLSIDSTGTLIRTAGAEAGSPVAPACPVGNIPLFTVYNVVGQTAIHDNDAQVGGQGYVLSDLRPFLGIGGGVLKLIQRGTQTVTITGVGGGGVYALVTGTANITITSVDTTKAFHRFSFYISAANQQANSWMPEIRGQITSATNLKLEVSANLLSTNSITFEVAWEVIEYL